jgi:hypothetical protein
MKSTRIAMVALLGALATTSAAHAHGGGNAVVGAVFGAGAGAVIGQAFGGRDGAIVGGAIGAVAGTAISSSSSRTWSTQPQYVQSIHYYPPVQTWQPPPRVYYPPAHIYYPPPGVYYPPQREYYSPPVYVPAPVYAPAPAVIWRGHPGRGYGYAHRDWQ